MIDRSQLLSIQGRGRKDQMKLAADFGISNFPPPAGGCLLTDPIFSRRLRDLLSHQKDRNIRDYELLKYGRHFRISENCKIIVGRNNTDNEALKKLSISNDLILNMTGFPGPLVLVPYGKEDDKKIASALCVRYSDAPDDIKANVLCFHNNMSETIISIAATKEDCERLII